MIQPGTKLAHYEIVSALGKGGMGEVWRARDTKLGREVAIKTLPEEFAKDADRLSRFEREAQLLASLNHPNIAAIHGIEEHDGSRFLVLELVEGETLADRIAQGPMPVDEALPLALQIADAIEAAHEKGVIHRDLKPANIKIAPDGQTKVLDFGLAKAFTGKQGDVNLSNSPTLSMQATQQGIILGTAGYMSPEQASGGASDKRADIWSFGVVLFEALAGRQVFTGDTISHVLAAVLAKDPEWSALPVNLNPKLRELLERCLEKDPKHRYHDIADVRLDLQKISADPAGLTVAPMGTPERAPAIGVKLLALVAAVAVSAAVLGWFLRPAPEPVSGVVTRFDIPLPDGQVLSRPEMGQLAIAPTGTRLAYVADNQIYVRDFGDMAPRAVPGTFAPGSGVGTPVFSPDGEWLAYVEVGNIVDSRLLRVPVSGGTPLEVFEGQIPGQPSWPTQDTLLFAAADGINRIPANGGEPAVVIPAGADESLFSPQLLPDGERVLFTRVSGTAPNSASYDAGQIYVQRIGGEDRTLVWEGGSDAHYLPSGHVVYAQGDTLWALRVDPDTFEVLAGPVSVVEGTQRSSAAFTDTAQYGVSDQGTLVHLPGTAISVSTTRSLFWVDPNGNPVRIPASPQEYRMARISPEGTRVALVVGPQGEGNLWVYDLEAATLSQLTFGEAEELYPVWTPDGERILFHSNDPDQQGLYSVAAIGGAPEFVAPSQGNGHFPTSITADGGTVLALTATSATDVSISVLDLGSSDEFAPLLAGDLIMGDPTLAPNGNWMASAEQEGNGTFVNVRPFPDVTRTRVVASAEVARHPVFSSDGSRLFYYRIGVGVFGVSVAYEPSLSVGNPEALVSGAYWWGVNGAGGGGGRAWDRHPTDGRFLMIGVGTDAGTDSDGSPPGPRINVILNWFQELRERVPVD